MIPDENDKVDSCYKCVSDFDEAGGCECIENEDCDQLKLIPEGCFNCGDEAVKYCSSEGEGVFEYCEKCALDFKAAGGCDCIRREDCHQLKLNPKECLKCREQSMKYCSSEEG